MFNLSKLPRLSRSAAAFLMTVGASCTFLAPLPAQAACQTCGTVISTHTYQQPAAHGSGLGIATGAVVGGLLGNQIGGGNGRTLATVAGAVGGGYAGNTVEKRMRSTTVTRVRVKMANGSIRTVSEPGNSRWYAGERVTLSRGALARR